MRSAQPAETNFGCGCCLQSVLGGKNGGGTFEYGFRISPWLVTTPGANALPLLNQEGSFRSARPDERASYSKDTGYPTMCMKTHRDQEIRGLATKVYVADTK